MAARLVKTVVRGAPAPAPSPATVTLRIPTHRATPAAMTATTGGITAEQTMQWMIGEAACGARHSTMSTPSIPACRWPATVQ